MPFIFLFIAIVGIIVGIQVDLWIQVIGLVVLFLFLHQSKAFDEFSGIFTVVFLGIFTASLVVGNISYAWQNDKITTDLVSNPFIATKEVSSFKNNKNTDKTIHLTEQELVDIVKKSIQSYEDNRGIYLKQSVSK